MVQYTVHMVSRVWGQTRSPIWTCCTVTWPWPRLCLIGRWYVSKREFLYCSTVKEDMLSKMNFSIWGHYIYFCIKICLLGGTRIPLGVGYLRIESHGNLCSYKLSIYHIYKRFFHLITVFCFVLFEQLVLPSVCSRHCRQLTDSKRHTSHCKPSVLVSMSCAQWNHSWNFVIQYQPVSKQTFIQ